MIAKEHLWPSELALWNDVVGAEDSDAQAGEGAHREVDPNDRQIRAELIHQLATNPDDKPRAGSSMIHVKGKAIVGDLDFEAASLDLPLQFEQCDIGTINLDQAEVPGLFIIDSTVGSLTAHQVQTRNIYLKKTTITTEVGLIDARITGVLNLQEAHFEDTVMALQAHNLRVEGDLLAMGFVADGEVDLTGAQIGGFLELVGATMSNGRGCALNGDSLSVGQDMLCRGLMAQGEIRLRGAHIAGILDLVEAEIDGSADEDGRALSGDLLAVDRDMYCGRDRDSLRALQVHGQLRLPGACIGGRLDLEGAQIINVGAKALFARGLSVTENLKCKEFRVQGDTNLTGAKIGRKLDLRDAVFEGQVILDSAKVHRLIDKGTNWPDKIELRDFEYDSFEGIGEPGSLTERLKWLKEVSHNNGYSPQIYNKLADAYRADGQDDAVRRVLIDKLYVRSLLRKESGKRLKKTRLRLVQFWDQFLRLTVGFGYRPLRIIPWALALLAFGAFRFSYLHAHANLVVKSGGGSIPKFDSGWYTVDLLLPVAGIGQRQNYVPFGEAIWFSGVFILLGWFLGLILVAGLTGLFKRD